MHSTRIGAVVSSFAILFTVFSTGTFASAASDAGVQAEYVPGEVVVKYKEGAVRDRGKMNKMYEDLGVFRVRRYSGVMSGVEHLYFDESTDVQRVVADLEEDSEVEYAEPNYIFRAQPVTALDAQGTAQARFMAPFGALSGLLDGSIQKADPAVSPRPAEVAPKTDPLVERLWGLQKTGTYDAWKVFRGGKNITVGVIDTGIDYNHEDLALNVPANKVGYDFVNNDALPYDDQGHGSHCAGTIGATGWNGKGVAGVTHRVNLMGLKFLNSKGGGTMADAVRAIDYGVEHGAKILSNSWGASMFSISTWFGPKALKQAIERAGKKGVLFVVAAGNAKQNNDAFFGARSFPAAYGLDNMISVAATDSKDDLASFSSYGKKTTLIAAPGVDILSTYSNNRYASASGTSMATPHVAGAAALVWSMNPTWTYKQVKQALLKSVDIVPSLSGKVATAGRLNVKKLIEEARQ